MSKLPLALSVSLLAFGMTSAASAQPKCNGDFALVDGSWVATRYCQRLVAREIAREDHERISQHPTRSNDMTPEEYCRWHAADIRTETYCSSYNE